MICKQCGESFTLKSGSNTKRKHCYKCRSFGKNMLQEHREGACICSVCNRPYHYERSKGHTKTKCGSCLVNERRHEVKRRAVAYKGGKCEICGYDRCLRALVFHHRNPKEKDLSVSGNHCRKWSLLRAELGKCALLCCRCHTEVHDGLVTLP